MLLTSLRASRGEFRSPRAVSDITWDTPTDQLNIFLDVFRLPPSFRPLLFVLLEGETTQLESTGSQLHQLEGSLFLCGGGGGYGRGAIVTVWIA